MSLTDHPPEGLKPTLVLHFSLSKDAMKIREQPETEVRNLKQLEDEWPEFKGSQWKLLWNYLDNVVALQLELPPEITEKVDGVYMFTTEFEFRTGHPNGQDRVTTIPCNQIPLIQLTKQLKYQHTFSSIKNNFYLVYAADNFSVTLKATMIKHTLSVISDVNVPPLALGNELGSLLTFEMGERKNNFTDTKISVANTGESSSPVLFFAHKAILAARSPVFSKMFEHDLQESATNSVTLSDIDPAVFKELLTYIYTGKAPHIQTLASSLLNAAEKYQLGRLKAMCERQISYGLQVENAAETLVLAHTYRANQLKKNALKFIIKHRNEVKETKDWEKVHNICELLEELLDTAVELATKSESIEELLKKFPKM